MRLDVPLSAMAAAASLFIVSVAAAQAPSASPPAQPAFAIPPFKNLQVFPKEISRADLIANMKLFSQSLGVRCSYCHVGTEGQPLSTFDFASDAKEHKKTARDMLRLAHHLNKDHLPMITGLPDAHVTCYTCHRGSTKPATAPPSAADTVPPPTGVPSPPKP
jgi:hypothetical protein